LEEFDIDKNGTISFSELMETLESRGKFEEHERHSAAGKETSLAAQN